MSRSMNIFLVLALAALGVTSAAQAPNAKDSDVGYWTVGDCILAQFAMTFEIHPNATAKNVTEEIKVPADAESDNAQSNCGEKRQFLNLRWKDPAKNDSSVLLERNFTISFALKPNDTYYGVDRVYGSFVMGKWMENETQHMSVLNMDSQEVAKLMFHTPKDRSFLCTDLGSFELSTTLNYDNSPPAGTKLANTTVHGSKVQFDAFRTPDAKPDFFRTPVDCDYKPNDVVPIAVGVALAGLVIAVLIAYVIGRRRSRQRGYQSV